MGDIVFLPQVMCFPHFFLRFSHMFSPMNCHSSHQVIQPEEEAAGDAVALLLDGFDGFDAAPAASARATLREAPEALRAALLVELANRLCWYSRLKVGHHSWRL